MKKSVLSFSEFVNESYMSVYEQSSNKREGETNWDFNFESGKFLKSDISFSTKYLLSYVGIFTMSE